MLSSHTVNLLSSKVQGCQRPRISPACVPFSSFYSAAPTHKQPSRFTMNLPPFPLRFSTTLRFTLAQEEVSGWHSPVVNDRKGGFLNHKHY